MYRRSRSPARAPRDRERERERHVDLGRDKEREKGGEREKERPRERERNGERGREHDLGRERDRDLRHDRYPNSRHPDRPDSRRNPPEGRHTPSERRNTDDDRRLPQFREREQDRSRVARERDREGGRSARRSASPPSRHSARPRSPAGSRSRSGSVPADKAKANFAPSGLLAAATNTVKAADGSGSSTVLKYNEPPEARKPLLGWRLYVFKGSEQVELLHIHRQSAYLIGRDRLVADIAIDHPSCSKQHAVIQYRQVHEKDEFGSSKPVIKPFIIDLESTNGTHVNEETIPVSRFYELKASDVIKFGQSTREYVILHDEVA